MEQEDSKLSSGPKRAPPDRAASASGLASASAEGSPLESKRDAASVFRLLTQLNRLASRRVDRALAEVDLSDAQYQALRALTEREATSGAEVAHSLKITPQAVVGLVGALERKGFITRAWYPGAGRSLPISVTPVGWDAFNRAKRRLRRLERDVQGAVSAEDYAATIALMEKLSKALSSD
jgi:DNA-binding MarR family transcriptional regulator